MLCTKEINECLTREKRNRYPLTFSNFGLALDRVSQYIYCSKILGVRWVGLNFHFPILWEVMEKEKESNFWTMMISKLGFLKPHENNHPVSD